MQNFCNGSQGMIGRDVCRCFVVGTRKGAIELFCPQIHTNQPNPKQSSGTAPLPPRSRLSHSTAATSRFLFAETSQHKHQVPTPTKPRHMILEYPTYHPNDSDISTLQNSSSEHNHSRSSSSISEINRSMGIPPGDRRRFRTVVPSRVFWTDPVDEFPEQYDSFLAPSPRMADSARSVQSARF